MHFFNYTLGSYGFTDGIHRSILAQVFPEIFSKLPSPSNQLILLYFLLLFSHIHGNYPNFLSPHTNLIIMGPLSLYYLLNSISFQGNLADKKFLIVYLTPSFVARPSFLCYFFLKTPIL